MARNWKRIVTTIKVSWSGFCFYRKCEHWFKLIRISVCAKVLLPSVKASMRFIESSFRQTSLVLLRLTTSELPKKESPNHDAKLKKNEKVLEKRAVLWCHSTESWILFQNRLWMRRTLRSLVINRFLTFKKLRCLSDEFGWSILAKTFPTTFRTLSSAATGRWD